MSLNIAAGLGLGGNESYPDLFQPFGGFPDGVEGREQLRHAARPARHRLRGQGRPDQRDARAGRLKPRRRSAVVQARPANTRPGFFLPAKQQMVDSRPLKLIPTGNLWQDKVSCYRESSCHSPFPPGTTRPISDGWRCLPHLARVGAVQQPPDLYDKVHRRDVLQRAWSQVRATTARRASTRSPWPRSRSTGCPGCSTNWKRSCGRERSVRSRPGGY